MMLNDLLANIDSRVTLVISGAEEDYKTKSDIPAALMNFEIETIKAGNNSLIVKLAKPEKVPSLEELGYSFEVGV